MERQLQPKPVSICGPSLGIVDAELLETSDSDSKLNTPAQTMHVDNAVSLPFVRT